MNTLDGAAPDEDPLGRWRRELAAERIRLDREQQHAEAGVRELMALPASRRSRAARVIVRCPRRHVLLEVHVYAGQLVVMQSGPVELGIDMVSPAQAATVEHRRSHGVLVLDQAGTEIRCACRCSTHAVSRRDLEGWIDHSSASKARQIVVGTS